MKINGKVIKEISVFTYIKKYKKHIDGNYLLPPPYFPCQYRSGSGDLFGRCRKANKILQQNYENQLMAYDFSVNLYKLNKLIKEYEKLTEK